MDQSQGFADLTAEIHMLREVINQLREAARECRDAAELCNILNALGLALTRLAGLVRVQQSLHGGDRESLDVISAAIQAVIEERGWKIPGELKDK